MASKKGKKSKQAGSKPKVPSSKKAPVSVASKVVEPAQKWQAKIRSLHPRFLAWVRQKYERSTTGVKTQFKRLGTSIRASFSALRNWIKERAQRMEKAFQAFLASEGFREFKHGFYLSSIGLLVTASVIALLMFGLNYHYRDKILPRTFVAGLPVGGLTLEQAQLFVNEKYQALKKAGFLFVVEGQSYPIPLSDLQLSSDVTQTIEDTFGRGHEGDFLMNQQLLALSLLRTTRVPMVIQAEEETLGAVLRERIPPIRQLPVNATVALEHGQFVVHPSSPSTSTDFASATSQIREAMNLLESRTISLPLLTAYPEVDTQEATLAKASADKLSERAVTLTFRQFGYDMRAKSLNLAKDKTWIKFYETNGFLDPMLDQDRLKAFLEQEIGKDIDQPHSDAIITMPPEGEHYATVEGTALDGLSVDITASLEKINQSVASGEASVELVVNFKPGKILTADGTDVGLRDLLSVGRSNFDGSPEGRAYNVRYGLKKFQNVIIWPEEEFNFNSFLGPVDYAHGWKGAKVIKANEDDVFPMEPGGGICQVSTTMFRSAVLAGLPVTERRPHTFVVHYYVGSHDVYSGIDATVYPGSQNLKFKNDTGHVILIQTYSEGNDAYIKFYGTTDGRQVELVGPKGGGLHISWEQIIRRAGGSETSKEEVNPIVSNYRITPVPKKPEEIAPTVAAGDQPPSGTATTTSEVKPGGLEG